MNLTPFRVVTPDEWARILVALAESDDKPLADAHSPVSWLQVDSEGVRT